MAAIAVVDALREQWLQIDDAALHTGLATVEWPARMEVVGREPWWLIDCAHNDESIERVLESLPLYFDYQRPIFVLGVLGDKDLQAMAARLQAVAGANRGDATRPSARTCRGGDGSGFRRLGRSAARRR